MKKGKHLTRDIIIQTLVNTLKSLGYVHAFWEGGAAAFNRIDEWSDLDLYLLVDDKRVSEAFVAVEKALKSLSPIEQKYEISQLPWPGVSQAFYKMKGASEYLLIDFVVLSLSSPEKFLEPGIHGNNVFYFNKSDKVKLPSLNRDAFERKLRERVERLKARFAMFNVFVQKEINRGNHLEAMDYYYVLTLSSLVEALRIKHHPFHHDFKMRYIHYELPSKVITKLERFFFLKDEKDLQKKYREATKWFHETMSTNNPREWKGC